MRIQTSKVLSIIYMLFAMAGILFPVELFTFHRGDWSGGGNRNISVYAEAEAAETASGSLSGKETVRSMELLPGTWAYYKTRFISSDGRIIDYYQRGISHSEGQGYGLLLAVLQDDLNAFKTIRQWTWNNLMVRKDGLAAWSWGERRKNQWDVLDYNNATDGDILIAWALLEGSRKWKNPEWKNQAQHILEQIQRYLVTQRGEKLSLLPAYFGFSDQAVQKINPSYFIFPAFRTFAAHLWSNKRSSKEPLSDERSEAPSEVSGLSDPSNSSDTAHVDRTEEVRRSPDGGELFWERLYNDGLELIRQASLTRFSLPPDWINLDQTGQILQTPGRGGGALFGFEAIRIPLYLEMAGDRKGLKLFSAYITFLDTLNYLPMSVDLTNNQISLLEASAGVHAVMAKCADMLGHRSIGKSLMEKASLKITKEHEDYYSHTLYLLACSVKL